jgi:spiro-SPASM protein
VKNISIINATALSPYTFQKLEDGSSAISRVVAFCRSLPEVQRVVCFTTEQKLLEQDVQQVVREDWDTTQLLRGMQEVSSGFSHIFYVYGDCPFLSERLSQRMYGNHIRYFAQYSFADGYPYGLSPEIVLVEVLPTLLRLSEGNHLPLKRTSLFDLIQTDINSFDVETEISSQDLRLLRVSLTTDSKRNLLLVNRLLEKGAKDDLSIVTLLQEAPKILRTLPAFFNVQIVEGCPQNCVYCPYPAMRASEPGKQDEMPPERFERILQQIEGFCEDAVVSVSLWGEPSYHSRIAELIGSVLNRQQLELVIETSGIGWSEDVFQHIKSEIEKSDTNTAITDKSLGTKSAADRAPKWIVSLDAWSEPVYAALRGEGFAEAVRTAERLSQLFPGSLYVQAVRMKKNEEDLEQFYRGWKTKIDNLIIQKYDHFCHTLPDDRVTDLSPLKRFPCWHNKRDVVILLDGSVPLCREDIGRENILGNIWDDGIEQIWKRGASVYEKHIGERYPSLCKECDEYYTYNF